MKKLLILSSILLLSAVCAMAQYGSQDTSNQSSASSGTSGSMTVQGCLSGSSGSYTLTDKSGTAYQLSGDTSKLAAHVGHTISVTGMSSSSSASTSGQSGSMSSPSDSHPTLMVSSFKHVSPTCNSASQ